MFRIDGQFNYNRDNLKRTKIKTDLESQIQGSRRE